MRARLTSTDELGTDPVKKRTRIITNDPALVEALKLCQCRRDHRHVQLLHGKASACQEYPIEFCRTICRAVAIQVDRDLKVARAGARKKATVSSISNGRERAAVLKNYVGIGRSQTARWANAAYRFANRHCNSIADTYVTSTDCTDLYSALVDASTLPGRVDAGREDG